MTLTDENYRKICLSFSRNFIFFLEGLFLCRTRYVSVINMLCRVYTKTHVARKHTYVSRTSNLYPDTYMSTDTCRRIHVARSGYMLTVSRRHNYYSFMSRSTCIHLYPAIRRATNWRQFCRRYKKHVDGNKWIQVDTTGIRQHVSWCKRGIRLRV